MPFFSSQASQHSSTSSSSRRSPQPSRLIQRPPQAPPAHDLWQKIQRGECLAHEVGGRICLRPSKTQPTAPSSNRPPPQLEGATAHPAPRPSADRRATQAQEGDFRQDLKVLFEGLQSELSSGKTALVVDHLKLLREEKHIIITLAESYIQKVKMMSEDILAAKNEVLAVKEESLQHLKAEVQQLKQALHASRQQVEDLELLNKALCQPPQQDSHAP